LNFARDEPSCSKFVSTSIDVVVQGRHAFKFGQAWIPAELLLTGLRRPPCCILREGGGVAPVEMCIEATITSHTSLCKWLPSCGQSSWFLFAALTAEMPQYTRDLVGNLFILLFFIFGYKETQSWKRVQD